MIQLGTGLEWDARRAPGDAVWDREPKAPEMQLSSWWKLLWYCSSHFKCSWPLFSHFLKEAKVCHFMGILWGFTLKCTFEVLKMVNQLFHYGVLMLFGWLQPHEFTQMLYIEYFGGMFCVWLIWVMVSIQKEQ